ncbi:MAG: glycerol-3-phosphate 1-O-acyltransferase PlsY [bacterium]|nr:glycerol-3-phosphate 1-O-acyltransferase PlsY [bacterium]
MLQVIPVVMCYFLGGIPSGLLIARAFGVSDIRQHGSGNIGATNVWRVVGGKAAFWVYLADISKGILAVFFGQFFFGLFESSIVPYDTLLVICAVAAVLGNVFSVYLNFRGGKGVNTSLGAVATLLPLESLIGLIAFSIVAFLSKYISAGSIVGVLTVTGAVYIERFILMIPIANVYLYLITVIAILFIYTHRQNIGRLVKGTENRFSFSTSKEAGSNV